MSLNRYVYARDNPMKMVDPNGHMFVLSYKVDQMDYSSGLSLNGAWTEADAVKEMEEVNGALLAPELKKEMATSVSGSVLMSGHEATEPTIGTLTNTATQKTRWTRASFETWCHGGGSGSSECGNTGSVSMGQATTWLVVGDMWLGTGLAVYVTKGLMLPTPLGTGAVEGDVYATDYAVEAGSNANPIDAMEHWALGFLAGAGEWFP